MASPFDVVRSFLALDLGRMAYRTPESRFAGVPDFPYGPNYVPVGDDLRMQYMDEGDGPPVVCLHGAPTWAYLYRHLISALSDTYRVVVPDFIGYGRSDKLTAVDAYSFNVHYETLSAFVDEVAFDEITLVVQDWGGLMGLAYAAHQPERIARLVILNTFLPTGEEEKSPAFVQWRRFVERVSLDLPIGRTIRRGLTDPSRLSDAEEAAYDAPFPTPESKAGAVAWPLLVPMSPDDPGADVMREMRRRLSEWSKPAFVLFAPDDPILGSAREFFRRLIPTATNEPSVTINDAGHFLQEDRGLLIAHYVRGFLERTT